MSLIRLIINVKSFYVSKFMPVDGNKGGWVYQQLSLMAQNNMYKLLSTFKTYAFLCTNKPKPVACKPIPPNP
jgi:hypothetical protein